jgi:hypothetical protein
MSYYFLMAYLPELTRDQTQVRFSLEDLLGEKFHIPPEDWREIETILLRGDVLILERLLGGKDPFPVPSLLGPDFWRQEIKSPGEGPAFLTEFLQGLEFEAFGPKVADQLYTTYFRQALGASQNPLLRGFVQQEWDIRNILAALRARRAGKPAVEHISGENEVAEAVTGSAAEDFGLAKDYLWIERLVSPRGPNDIQETQERILWDYLDENTGGGPFSLDALLAYVLKLQILEHRLSRSDDRGLELLGRLEAR